MTIELTEQVLIGRISVCRFVIITLILSIFNHVLIFNLRKVVLKLLVTFPVSTSKLLVEKNFEVFKFKVHVDSKHMVLTNRKLSNWKEK